MRNGKIFITTLISLTCGAIATHGQSLPDLVAALDSMPGYAAEVTYAVTLPQAEDDVVYNVRLQQPASPSAYLIDWDVTTPSGPVGGFTAWFDGHFYNFRNKRLQELHSDWDEAAATTGPRAPQNTAQFASLLPSRLAMQLRELDSETYSYTLSASADEVRIDAVRLTAGEPDAELQWTFDAATLRPLRFYGDYNPGAIASQQVSATYSYDTPDSTFLIQNSPLSEAVLRRLYPDAFELYRESQFAIETMRGELLPAFSLPVCGAATRLTRRAGDPFAAPTLLVLLDSESALAPQLVSSVRKALDRLPANADVIWGCTSKNPDAVSDLLGALRPGETAIFGSRSLARDCGAATLPVAIALDRSGRVADLLIGLNQTLETDVIRMLSSLK